MPKIRPLATVVDEYEQLSRFSQLLDMTKLESAPWRTTLHDLSGRRQRPRRANKILAHHRVDLRLPRFAVLDLGGF
jgi:uncharacterized phage-associated protein